MIWWKPTYPAPRYRTWSATAAFRLKGKLGHAIVDQCFIPSEFPEPINDRDSLRW